MRRLAIIMLLCLASIAMALSVSSAEPGPSADTQAYYAALQTTTPTRTPTPTLTNTPTKTATPYGALEIITFQPGLHPNPFYTDVQDTFLSLWEADVAYGEQTHMTLRSDGAQRPLIKFDVSAYVPFGAPIVEATLSLWMYYANPTSGSTDVDAYAVKRTWDETTVTWNFPWSVAGCEGYSDREMASAGQGTVQRHYDWASWDVTHFVRDWVSGAAPNKGLLLLPPYGEFSRLMYFRSSDFVDVTQRPKLVVTFYRLLPTPTTTPDATSTPTVTPIPCTIEGSVTLQRPSKPAPDPSWVVALTVSLGDTDYAVTTDPWGHFTLTGLTQGIHDIRVKNAHTLANSMRALLVRGPNSLHFGTLLEGDANDNNCVNITDFSILSNGFVPGYDAHADFNQDGLVNITDFSLLKGNFGQCGDISLSGAGGG